MRERRQPDSKNNSGGDTANGLSRIINEAEKLFRLPKKS
jgi:hypothetical protein